MIDNKEQILKLLDFSKDGTFFFVQILKRKKDQSESDPQKSDNKIIKDYFIKSIEDLEKKYPEIKDLCNFFNARAYIRLNRCFHDRVALETLGIISEYLLKGNPHNVKSAYTTACGRRCYDPDKKWIVDVDFQDGIDQEKLEDYILKANSGFENNIVAKIPTKNGFHWITRPFDAREISKVFPEIEIHKNNPTILYCP